jgi:hypothetical protein
MKVDEFLPECPICFIPLKTELATTNICGHVFHMKWYIVTYPSLKQSLANLRQCPMCRADCLKPIGLRFDFKERVLPRDTNEAIVENEKLKEENNNLRLAFDDLQDKYNKILEQIESFTEQAKALQV